MMVMMMGGGEEEESELSFRERTNDEGKKTTGKKQGRGFPAPSLFSFDSHPGRLPGHAGNADAHAADADPGWSAADSPN